MKERFALLSVYDKSGIAELAHVLNQQGFTLLSTGGTARALRSAGFEVRDVSQITGFPEMMEGRLKTLHPVIQGGILGRPEHDGDKAEMEMHGIKPIEFVVGNLYPFNQVVQQESVSWDEALENIDIGGPTMLRAAAKNHHYVTVLCDPGDYSEVMEMLKNQGEVSAEARQRFAVKAIRHTAYYDACISSWLAEHSPGQDDFPGEYAIPLVSRGNLRYGENPHQKAAIYAQRTTHSPSLLTAKQLQGKELSYNNYNDGNAALEILLEFSEPTAIVIKHGVPCAAASASSIARAFAHCYAADPVSIYGGVVALNRPLDRETA
ncbi:MAG: bifunctional phosphoribosylaminoimidazolecarboxamide formyltransferase/IMP cyclohydrolase, partial [Symbiobacteriaceae bacterium]|nr:bifunctional phosphoribosylaminoimidazolecarboxamide formyltransferase/IMP cyclohydrolase [Symbiobacteriaceae bacterium]